MWCIRVSFKTVFFLVVYLCHLDVLMCICVTLMCLMCIFATWICLMCICVTFMFNVYLCYCDSFNVIYLKDLMLCFGILC